MTILNEYQYKIVLFDGVCNFCNYWVNFILDRDSKKQFKFAALQSKKGIKLLEKFNLPKDDFDSFVLIFNDKVFKKSNAAFKIAKHINGWPKLILPFQILPSLLTDFIYDIVAKNRYKLFGKKETCRIPSSQELKRFI